MLNSSLVARLIDISLDEDLCYGDVTTQCCIPCKQVATASIIAKEELVLCGQGILKLVVQSYCARYSECTVLVQDMRADGEIVRAGELIGTIRSDSRTILALERTMLNFLQRLSGIATHVRALVAGCPGLLKVLDTRKTTPGWRVLEKYAVKVGGAENHRFSLGDMILVKNNHIDLRNGDIDSLLTDVFSNKPIYMPVEVEVRDLAELGKALPYKPTIVMLDNMGTEMIVQAVKLVHQFKASSGFAPMIEVSGGITRERLQELAQSGVDAVSMGALTHQARAVDISMKVTAVS